MAAMMLGAGRETIEDQIDPAVGIVLSKKVGDYVEKGETLAELHVNGRKSAPGAIMQMVEKAYTWSEQAAGKRTACPRHLRSPGHPLLLISNLKTAQGLRLAPFLCVGFMCVMCPFSACFQNACRASRTIGSTTRDGMRAVLNAYALQPRGKFTSQVT